MTIPVVLTIAGLDPSGGAGVIADAQAIRAFGCSPAAAVTSITFQNDQAVHGSEHLSADTIRRQVLAVLETNEVAGLKTGMLPTSDSVLEVVRLCREEHLPAPVVDPVMRSTSGYSLVEDQATSIMLSELLPLARLITPNIPEAELITGRKIVDLEGMKEAAAEIRQLGARAVLIKGGHLENKDATEAIDVLNDEGTLTILRGDWISNRKLRGTGCLLSSAIAACLANGESLENSIMEAKVFVETAIKSAIINTVSRSV
jgi:hydroxymethylpyrimidine kinase/phosphomethylpyrimidine kinase